MMFDIYIYTKLYTSIFVIYMGQQNHCYWLLTTYGHPNEMLKLRSDLRRCFNKTLVMAMTLPGKNIRNRSMEIMQSFNHINATISTISIHPKEGYSS